LSTQPIDLQVSLPDARVAMQLAQLCKRIGFAACYELTEAHLSAEERKERAYQMIAGMDRVASALADQGFAPR
jgi:hypothetical protein